MVHVNSAMGRLEALQRERAQTQTGRGGLKLRDRLVMFLVKEPLSLD
jgi:hypothetical protein